METNQGRWLSPLLAAMFLLSVIGILFGWGAASALATISVISVGGLILVGALPHLESFKFGPTGIEGKTIQIVEAKVRPISDQVHAQEAKIDQQKEVLEQQQKIINDLVIYSLAELSYRYCGG